MKPAYSYFITVKMNANYAIKIQRWWRLLPECCHCGDKRLAYNYVCHECYHDKHRKWATIPGVMPGV